jgi:YspA, cpYpsA-related SLOG family
LASLIASRDFIAAKRRANIAPLTQAGTRVALTGGLDYADHKRIWAVLDMVHSKYPDMVLLHGGSPKGAERIAACWAKAHQIVQIQFRPG